MTKPIRDIVMAESTRSHTSNALSVPDWNDQYDSSITNASAMTASASTILYNGSSSPPPDEVYIPAPVGASSNPAEPEAISQQPGASIHADDWSTGSLTSKRLDDLQPKSFQNLSKFKWRNLLVRILFAIRCIRKSVCDMFHYLY
jgi:hypothetical protein